MNQAHRLAVLYELAMVMSGTTRSQTLLCTFLQRLMFHTGFPCGLFLESSPGPAGDGGVRLGCAIGDPVLGGSVGQRLSLPPPLVEGPSSLLEDEALLAGDIAGMDPWHSGLRLRVDEGSAFLLLSPEAPRGDLPPVSMFDPVLRNFGRVLQLCRTNESQLHELEAANRELEAFSYSVSHDLRAPLRAIDGFSQVLVEDYDERLDDSGREYLQRMRSGVLRMSELIDDLLTLSRTTQAQFERESVDLGELARKTLARLALEEPERCVETRVADGLVAWADPDLAAILLDNLLANAWKYTGRRQRARIEFDATSIAGETVFFIRDNGAGFDMRYADKLFVAFQRLHRPGEFSGTGVGLATVQRIVQRHGGRIWAEAEPDRGATFYFTLSAGGGHDAWGEDHDIAV